MEYKLNNCGGASSSGDVFLAYPSYLTFQKEDSDNYDFLSVTVKAIVEPDTATGAVIATVNFDSSGFCMVDLTERLRAIGLRKTLVYEFDIDNASTAYRRRAYIWTRGWEDSRCLYTQPRIAYILSNLNRIPNYYNIVPVGYLPPSWVYGATGEKIGDFILALPVTEATSSLKIKIGLSSSITLLNTEFLDTAVLLDVGALSERDYDAIQVVSSRNESLCFYRTRSLKNKLQSSTYTHHLDSVAFAYVKWRNRFGSENIILFEIHDWQRITDDTLAIDSLPSQAYNIRKSYHYKGVIFRNALTAYDIWFFSDIITSPSVQMAFSPMMLFKPDGTDESTFDSLAWTDINITTDKLKIPTSDAGGPFTLKIDFDIYNTNGYFN